MALQSEMDEASARTEGEAEPGLSAPPAPGTPGSSHPNISIIVNDEAATSGGEGAVDSPSTPSRDGTQAHPPGRRPPPKQFASPRKGVRVLSKKESAKETMKAKLRRALQPYLAATYMQGEVAKRFTAEYIDTHPPPEDEDDLPAYISQHLKELNRVTERWSGCVLSALDPLAHQFAIDGMLQRQRDQEEGKTVQTGPVYQVRGHQVRPYDEDEDRSARRAAADAAAQALSEQQLASALEVVSDITVWEEILAARAAEERRQHSIASLHLHHAARIIQRSWRTYTTNKKEEKARLDALVSPDVQVMLSAAAYKAMRDARNKMELMRLRKSLSRRAKGFGSTAPRDVGPAPRSRAPPHPPGGGGGGGGKGGAGEGEGEGGAGAGARRGGGGGRRVRLPAEGDEAEAGHEGEDTPEGGSGAATHRSALSSAGQAHGTSADGSGAASRSLSRSTSRSGGGGPGGGVVRANSIVARSAQILKRLVSLKGPEQLTGDMVAEMVGEGPGSSPLDGVGDAGEDGGEGEEQEGGEGGEGGGEEEEEGERRLVDKRGERVAVLFEEEEEEEEEEELAGALEGEDAEAAAAEAEEVAQMAAALAEAMGVAMGDGDEEQGEGEEQEQEQGEEGQEQELGPGAGGQGPSGGDGGGAEAAGSRDVERGGRVGSAAASVAGSRVGSAGRSPLDPPPLVADAQAAAAEAEAEAEAATGDGSVGPEDGPSGNGLAPRPPEANSGAKGTAAGAARGRKNGRTAAAPEDAALRQVIAGALAAAAAPVLGRSGALAVAQLGLGTKLPAAAAAGPGLGGVRGAGASPRAAAARLRPAPLARGSPPRQRENGPARGAGAKGAHAGARATALPFEIRSVAAAGLVAEREQQQQEGLGGTGGQGLVDAGAVVDCSPAPSSGPPSGSHPPVRTSMSGMARAANAGPGAGAGPLVSTAQGSSSPAVAASGSLRRGSVPVDAASPTAQSPGGDRAAGAAAPSPSGSGAVPRPAAPYEIRSGVAAAAAGLATGAAAPPSPSRVPRLSSNTGGSSGAEGPHASNSPRGGGNPVRAGPLVRVGGGSGGGEGSEGASPTGLGRALQHPHLHPQSPRHSTETVLPSLPGARAAAAGQAGGGAVGAGAGGAVPGPHRLGMQVHGAMEDGSGLRQGQGAGPYEVTPRPGATQRRAGLLSVGVAGAGEGGEPGAVPVGEASPTHAPRGREAPPGVRMSQSGAAAALAAGPADGLQLRGHDGAAAAAAAGAAAAATSAAASPGSGHGSPVPWAAPRPRGPSYAGGSGSTISLAGVDPTGQAAGPRGSGELQLPRIAASPSRSATGPSLGALAAATSGGSGGGGGGLLQPVLRTSSDPNMTRPSGLMPSVHQNRATLLQQQQQSQQGQGQGPQMVQLGPGGVVGVGLRAAPGGSSLGPGRVRRSSLVGGSYDGPLSGMAGGGGLGLMVTGVGSGLGASPPKVRSPGAGGGPGSPGSPHVVMSVSVEAGSGLQGLIVNGVPNAISIQQPAHLMVQQGRLVPVGVPSPALSGGGGGAGGGVAAWRTSQGLQGQ